MCDKELLLGYLYDDLAPGERRLADAHLQTCEDCRTELAGLRGTRTTLSAWTPPTPDLAFPFVRPAAVPAPRVGPGRSRRPGAWPPLPSSFSRWPAPWPMSKSSTGRRASASAPGRCGPPRLRPRRRSTRSRRSARRVRPRCGASSPTMSQRINALEAADGNRPVLASMRTAQPSERSARSSGS